MDAQFEGLHVVVTGASGELGLAVAQDLAARGATMHLPVRRTLELERFDASVRERVHVHSGIDLADESAVARYYAALPTPWASVNCVGAFSMQSLEEASVAEWNALVAANVLPALSCTREAVRRMRGRGGRIVNVAAALALEPRLGAGKVLYTMTKAAVAALTEAAAEEVAREDILINAVAPSVMDTVANRRAMPEADFDSWAKLADVAATIAFLASPQNRVTRGAVLPVRGRA